MQMNIVHVIAPISFGGGESLLCNLLKEKRKDLCEKVVMFYFSEPFEQRLKQSGIEVIRIRDRSIGQGISRFEAFWETFVNFLWIFKLFNTIKKTNCDIIHVHGYPSCLLISLINPLLKKKTVYTHHFFRTEPKLKIEKKIFEWIYGQFDVLTGVSCTVSESMNRAFDLSKEFITAYNCISTDFFEYTPSSEFAFLKKTGKLIFVQIARFAGFKNQILVVKCLQKMDKNVLQKMKMVFVGSGPEFDRVKEYVHEHNLDQWVIFLGHIEYDIIPSLLEQCDYGVFPSDLEGFGIGAVECMAKGLPILAIDNILMREIVRNYGLLIEKENLTQGFQRILSLKFDRNEIRKYAKRFLPENIKNKYCEVYKGVLS